MTNEERKKKRAAYMRLWNAKNPDRVRASRAAKYLRNREKILAASRAYAAKNRENVLERKRAYRLKNLERARSAVRDWHRRNRKTPAMRLRAALYTRLTDAMSGRVKSARTMELIGCSTGHLKAHLQSRFKAGMTWENHGRFGWHIDHIRPCAAFDLSDPAQQRACFNYANLQPLWAAENLSKGARMAA